MPSDVFCVETAGWERRQLEAAFDRHPALSAHLLEGPLHGHLEALGEAEVLSVFIRSRIDAAALDALPAVRLIATRSTGFDHVDTGACSARGVTVVNVPTYGETTVAEHTFALILALSRRLVQADRRGRRGELDVTGLQGFDLHGKTLGVVGAGRIGLHVIRMARGFGMEVLAADPAPNQLLAEVIGFAYAELPELLERADVVSLHAPAVPATNHLIDAAALARMRPGAVLVNTARGSLVDTAALVAALDAGRLGGAGLDVFEGERDVREEHELLGADRIEDLRTAFGRRLLAEHENVILTPHTGFNSHEAVQRLADTTADSIAAWRAGRPVNVVGGEVPA